MTTLEGALGVGRTVAHRLGWILIDKKYREMGGPLALDGRRLMGGHNNQSKVSIDGGRGIEEERQLGRNMWGGVVSLLGAAN